MKIHQHNAGHMTKMATMPRYGKNTLKSSFQEPLPGLIFGETLYEALGALALYILFKL